MRYPWENFGQSNSFFAGKEYNPDVAAMAAGLRWKVFKCPIRIEKDAIDRNFFPAKVRNPEPEYVEVPDTFAIVRSSDNFVLGTVGNSFVPVQNSALFELIEALRQGIDGVEYTNAGNIRDGKSVWVCARYPKSYSIRERTYFPHIFVRNAHDGTFALRVSFALICKETGGMLILDTMSEMKFVFRHTEKNAKFENLVKKIKDGATRIFEKFESKMLRLTEKNVTSDLLEEFVAAVFPEPKDPKASELKTIREERDLLKRNYLSSGNNDAFSLLYSFVDYVCFGISARGTKNRTAQEIRFAKVLEQKHNDAIRRAISALMEEDK